MISYSLFGGQDLRILSSPRAEFNAIGGLPYQIAYGARRL